MRRLDRALLAILGVLATAGCGGSPLSDGASATITVSPTKGGTLELPVAGVRLDVPAGAVATTVSITMRPANGAAPAGITPDGPVIEFEPSGLVFAKPATVTFSFEHADRPTIYWTNSSGAFESLGGRVNGLRIATEITHFSRGFVGELKPPIVDAAVEDVPSTTPIDAPVIIPDAGVTMDVASDRVTDTARETPCRPRVAASGVWVNRTPPVLPAAWPIVRYTPAVIYDPTSRKVVMSGGYGGPEANFRKDTWEWDGATGTWRQVLVTNPPFDDGTSFAYDSTRQRMVLFAGYTRQLWEWNGVTSTWTNRTPATLPGSWPPVMNRTTTTYDPDRRRVVVFDISYDVRGSKAFEWDPATESWTARTLTQAPVSVGVTFIWDPLRHRSVNLDGGATPDLWEWDGVTGSWTVRPPPVGALVPSPRSGAAVAFDEGIGRTVLFGGQSPGGPLDPATGPAPPSYLNDLWSWGGEAGEWLELDDGLASVAPRDLVSKVMVYDTDRSSLVVIGAGASVASAEVWEWSRVVSGDAGVPGTIGCGEAGAP